MSLCPPPFSLIQIWLIWSIATAFSLVVPFYYFLHFIFSSLTCVRWKRPTRSSTPFPLQCRDFFCDSAFFVACVSVILIFLFPTCLQPRGLFIYSLPFVFFPSLPLLFHFSSFTVLKPHLSFSAFFLFPSTPRDPPVSLFHHWDLCFFQINFLYSHILPSHCTEEQGEERQLSLLLARPDSEARSFLLPTCLSVCLSFQFHLIFLFIAIVSLPSYILKDYCSVSFFI